MREAQQTLAKAALVCSLTMIASNVSAQEDTAGGAVPAVEDAFVEHINFAYAQVLRVAPVYEKVQVARLIPACPAPDVIGTTVSREGADSGGAAVVGRAIQRTFATSGEGGHAAADAMNQASGLIDVESAASGPADCPLIEHYMAEERLTGYDVEYRYRGEVFVSRLAQDPGDRLRIRVAVAPAVGAADYRPSADTGAARY